MQPPTEPAPAAPASHGDEDELYRRHHRDLHRAVAHAVGAPRELIEDACQTAWAILLRTQPDRYAIFGWLRVVAIREAYRLSGIDRRALHLERLNVDEHGWEELIADPRTLEDAHEALEALPTVASLPERQRSDLTLKVAGYSYDEIRALTPGRTFTNVISSHVVIDVDALRDQPTKTCRRWATSWLNVLQRPGLFDVAGVAERVEEIAGGEDVDAGGGEVLVL